MAKRVLLVRFSALGDLVLTTGPLYQLKRAHPTLSIDLLTSEVGEELFINSIDIDRVFRVPKGSGLLTLTKVYSQLPKYDYILDLQNNFKSHYLKLFVHCRSFRINKHSKERRAFVKNRKYKEQLQKHVTEKYYEVFQKAFNLKDLQLEELRPRFPTQPITMDNTFNLKEAIIIHPYASQKNKEWPYIADLVDQLILNHTPVVIIGAAQEPVTLPQHDLILDLTNKTSIREMASFISSGKALITTDSGPMHLGIATNKPTVALFGPTTKELGFYPEFNNTRVAEILDLECRPCHIHGGNVCPKTHHNCMVQISVDNVLTKLKEII